MNRMKCQVGHKIGDVVCGKKVTGLGKEFDVRVTDDTACCYGMQPGLDHYPTVKMQYVYFN